MDTAKAAKAILHGVARNRPLIVIPRHARVLWWLYRFNASLLDPIGYKMVRDFRNLRTATLDE